MKKGVSKLTIALISVIIVLLGILAYGVYTGMKVKAELINLNSQISTLVNEKNELTSKVDSLQQKDDLLLQDVAKIYKTCMNENACKGRYPNISWYCNNVGDEVSDPSHICVCDSSCNLNATAI
jgi:hypothetical protein